jgi:hypothetical protein
VVRADVNLREAKRGGCGDSPRCAIRTGGCDVPVSRLIRQCIGCELLGEGSAPRAEKRVLGAADNSASSTSWGWEPPG